MFKWSYSQTVETNATPEQIWTLWEDVESWPSWDKDLKWVKLNGPFKVGTKGTMKPTEGPKINFELIEVKQNKLFTDRAKLPLTTMDFYHIYKQPEKIGQKATIQHKVEMNGFLAPIFGYFVGKKIMLHLKQAMLDLSTQAVENKKFT
ncbi:SRPBCC family protein [Acinetobacter oleivorans]|uniref:SRPBCC family protein n=1 Tax=Acinetobacter oleivorans TaxID=1148157 RepID=UPI00124F8161|nr:SRPBCC family protein [Acinetobacter oleivorans]